MVAILDLLKLGMMKRANAEMVVINIFLAPRKHGCTKIKFIPVSDDEI